MILPFIICSWFFIFTQAFVKETSTTQHHPCFEREHARYIPNIRAQPEIIKAIISSEELVDRAFKSKGYSVSILFIFHIFFQTFQGETPDWFYYLKQFANSFIC